MAASEDGMQVVEHILQPFHDIVNKATEATTHACATDTAPMHKTAESLVREGQRALNRLEPLSKRILGQHGSAFVNAIKSNEDIASFHLELTDSLWEFDDYITAETFDADKYSQLQALCRSIAPKIYNALVRLNIELLAKGPERENTPPNVPHTPPTSPPMSASSSTYSWQSPMTMAESSMRGLRPWSGNSVNGFNNLHPVLSGSQFTRDSSQINVPFSLTSAASMDVASLHREHQLYSSGHSSSISSGSQSSRGMQHSSVIKMQERQSSLRPWGSPGRVESRHHLNSSAADQGGPRRVSGEYESENMRRRVTFEHAGPPTRLPSMQCVIDASSSFHRYKGFCQGAQEILRGNDGVKQKQKPVHRTLSRVVAKCTGCSMELDYEKIEEDLASKESGNLTRREVCYRLRFLQKSHLPVKRATDAQYGCIFCIQNGYTTEESDATVFFSADDLFTHLSRHPRPLPAVAGITVVYGMDVASMFRNNYDIHFKSPPKFHPIHRDSTEVEGRPTGIATKEVRRTEPQRNLVDRDRPEELQVAIGARLTGIKWPPQYKGRRIFAWHEGNFASVPSEMVKLIPPANHGLRKGGRTCVSGKAKWKFAAKYGKDVPWLKFAKGDAITNICWEHPDHWCWCGTNSRGEWGMFPQAFIDPNTVQGSITDDNSSQQN